MIHTLTCLFLISFVSVIVVGAVEIIMGIWPWR